MQKSYQAIGHGHFSSDTGAKADPGNRRAIGTATVTHGLRSDWQKSTGGGGLSRPCQYVLEDHNAALVRRGSLTLWFTDEAVAAWHAPATGERGGQPVYSSIAIETGLLLRLVFRQPLRQTEGLLRSIAEVRGIAIAIPDHTTLSRRGGGLTILPKRIDRAEPSHLLVDSTGLKIYGEAK
jgi:hypothetical protein